MKLITINQPIDEQNVADITSMIASAVDVATAHDLDAALTPSELKEKVDGLVEQIDAQMDHAAEDTDENQEPYAARIKAMEKDIERLEALSRRKGVELLLVSRALGLKSGFSC